MNTHQTEPSITKLFLGGARKGWRLATTVTLPNLLMAFLLLEALKLSGSLPLLTQIVAPLMSFFRLPGEAITVLCGAWMSIGGGVSIALTLFHQGLLSPQHLAILTPAIYLMGSQLQYLRRILAVIELNDHKLVMSAIALLNALLAMLLLSRIV